MNQPHRFGVRVYFEDTDFSGLVYHTAYLHYLERARTEFLRSLGVHHSELMQQGVFFAVRSMQIAFDRAARIDDLLEVETRVAALSAARLTLDQRILKEGVPIMRAEVLVVALATGGRPTRMPKAVLARFGTIDRAPEANC